MKPPNHPFVKLTQRQFDILKKMQDENEEIAGSGFNWYCGDEKTNWKTVKTLLEYVLISGWFDKIGTTHYLHINESGIRYLAGERLIYPIANDLGKVEYRSSHNLPLGLL